MRKSLIQLNCWSSNAFLCNFKRVTRTSAAGQATLTGWTGLGTTETGSGHKHDKIIQHWAFTPSPFSPSHSIWSMLLHLPYSFPNFHNAFFLIIFSALWHVWFVLFLSLYFSCSTLAALYLKFVFQKAFPYPHTLLQQWDNLEDFMFK